MKFLKSTIKILKRNKKYWLFPVITIFIFLLIILFVTQGTVIAPFLYTN